MPSPRRATPPSDDWMLEQQMRAEIEAETWRRLRHEAAARAPAALAEPAQPPAARPAFDPHRSGSLTLKALVRFVLAAAVSYLAYLAAMDGGLGEFEAWLAIGAAFITTLALSALDPLRRAVHALAETARWSLITALILGVAWLVFQAH